MAISEETILQRIERVKVKIEKAEKSLAKYRKLRDESGKDFYDYDIRHKERELRDYKEHLSIYESQLAVIREKKSKRNIKAILDFLELWKSRVFDWYKTRADELKELEKEVKKEIPELVHKYYPQYHEPENEDGLYPGYTEKDWKIYFEGKGVEDRLENLMFSNSEDSRISLIGKDAKRLSDTDLFKENPELIEKLRKIRSLKNDLSGIPGVYTYAGFDEKKLRNVLDREAEDKYDFIIARTEKIVGEITDASNLSIGYKGDLNGRIDGTDGSAWVETIGAGGYNIQCFHFRTLIKPIKMNKNVREAEKWME